MNKITRSNVDVQPYAFTTKSLFVGHCDYKYLRWQVIDTPGILDHPLEDRNTIEMQAIVALAHLTCSVLYFVDISEQCGYTIEQQCSLFKSIKPLFANKQLIIVVNKIDQQPWETLAEEKRDMLNALVDSSPNCSLLTMSNISEEGISNVKATACEKLLATRVDSRIAGKKIEGVMNRLQVFIPKPRDNVQREATIPESVKRAQEAGSYKPQRSRTGYAPTKDDAGGVDDDDNDGDVNMGHSTRKTARDLMWEHGGPGVWAPDYRELYDLKDETWKFDAIPEIMDGKNVADYVDPDILLKLEELEREEDQIVAELEAARMGEEEESDLDSEEEAAVEAIRDRKKKVRTRKLANQTQNKPMTPHAIRGKGKDKHDRGALDGEEIRATMESLGVDASKMLERGRAMERERGRKRERSLSRLRRRGDEGEAEDMEMEDVDASGMSKKQLKKRKKEVSGKEQRELSRTRSHSRPREPSQMGLKDEKSVKIVEKLERKGRKNWTGAAGEGDNRKSVHLVKWCNTGKKRMGTHYQR